MARLFIPACGDRITVAKPWQFKLYLERRNTVFAEANGHTLPSSYTRNIYIPDTNDLAWEMHTIDAGTELECDRVYIRANSKAAESAEDSYDSITWKVITGGKPSIKQRFWVKLEALDHLDYDEASISRYQDRK